MVFGNLNCFIYDYADVLRVMKRFNRKENEHKRQIAARYRQDLRMLFEEIRDESRL